MFADQMNYDRHILYVLAEAGQAGLSVSKIARHVFNATNGFFSETSYDDVHLYVRHYLQRQVLRKNAFIKRVSHGIYQLDLCSGKGKQLVLSFKDITDATQKTTPEDKSLSLF